MCGLAGDADICNANGLATLLKICLRGKQILRSVKDTKSQQMHIVEH
jgi:lipopolysaccharide biosynthesis glycosyltransferase